MRKLRNTLAIVMAAGGLCIFSIGCENGQKADSDHPHSEHPDGDHPHADHPNGEHPTTQGEHPKADHPKGDHPG